MARTTRTFLLTALGSSFGVSGLGALPPVGGFLIDRPFVAALVFPGLGRGSIWGTVLALAGFALVVTGGARVVLRWSGFGASWAGVVVCFGLVGGPAGVGAVLGWARLHGVPFEDHARYAAAWGMAVALVSGSLALAVARLLAGPGSEVEPGTAPAGGAAERGEASGGRAAKGERGETAAEPGSERKAGPERKKRGKPTAPASPGEPDKTPVAVAGGRKRRTKDAVPAAETVPASKGKPAVRASAVIQRTRGGDGAGSGRGRKRGAAGTAGASGAPDADGSGSGRGRKRGTAGVPGAPDAGSAGAGRAPRKAREARADGASAGAAGVAGARAADTRGRRWGFRERGWVLPGVVGGWAVATSVGGWEPGVVAWLPFGFGYFEQVAVVLAVVAVATLEGALRERLPVDGRPGRSFVLAWIAASVAPIVYAAVVAIDRGMRELLLAEPLNLAWFTEYVSDAGAALVAEPAQVAVPPLLLAATATALRTVLPWREREPGEPDPVRTDRRWSLLVAGAAPALTYFCLAATSRFDVLTTRTHDDETPLMPRSLALLAPPDPVLGHGAVVWSWAVTAVFGVAAAGLTYLAVRGQLVRVFPVSSYLVLVGTIALAAALAWNLGGAIGHAVTGQRPLGISPATEAAAFTGFAAPVFAAVLFIVHSQVGVTRFARIVRLDDGGMTWERLAERYRAWREEVRGHVPGWRERGLVAARVGGGALVVAAVAGALRGLGLPDDLSEGHEISVVLPALSLGLPGRDNVTGALYVVLLAGLTFAGLAKVNLKERPLSAWLAIWGLSVVAGGLAGVAGGLPGAVGLQMGLVAGVFAMAVPAIAEAVVAGLGAVPRRRALVAGGVVLAGLAALPVVRGMPAREPAPIGTTYWRGQQQRLTIDVAYPRVTDGDAARVNAVLAAPMREYVEGALRAYRADPGLGPGVVTGSYVVVRNDAAIISVRYVMTGEAGGAVTYDRAAGRALGVAELFAPAAFTPAGRRRLADVVRPLVPKGHDPRTVTVDSDRLLVNLVADGVELTFGRDYFCLPCAPFTVRVPSARLTGLLRWPSGAPGATITPWTLRRSPTD